MYRFHTRNRGEARPTVATCDAFHYSLRHISFQFKRGWGAKGEWISHRIMMNSELVYFSKYCLPDIKYFYNPVNIMEIRLQDAANGTSPESEKDITLSLFPEMQRKKKKI